ncbi:MAG: hypothetical protein A2W33_07865 [Chloroflexi bacterium RBG_16_52_11]|nr:MAG: hypothetical protein A2W33_07865 [Chloroflexi bacterium RBG_16_52_11]
MRESYLPDEVKAHLSYLQKSIANSRLLFVRNQLTSGKDSHSFFIAYASHDDPCLYEIQIDDYTQLLSIDLSAIQSEVFSLQHRLVNERLILICTNGKRDPCCSKWGLPTYNAVASNREIFVMQTSHVGGHRFAANMICLPHGIYYGRVAPDDAIAIVRNYQDGNIHLNNYRGRAIYPGVAQAADYYLRDQTNDMRLDAYQLESISDIGAGNWEVIFSNKISGKTYRLQLVAELSAQTIYESCSTPDDLKPIKKFRLIQSTEDASRD